MERIKAFIAWEGVVVSAAVVALCLVLAGRGRAELAILLGLPALALAALSLRALASLRRD